MFLDRYNVFTPRSALSRRAAISAQTVNTRSPSAESMAAPRQPLRQWSLTYQTMNDKLIKYEAGFDIALVPAEKQEALIEELLTLWRSLESEDSQRAYKGDWSRWCKWCRKKGISPAEAHTMHVQKYLIELHQGGKAKATRQRMLAVLRKVYAVFVRAEILPVNPAREAENIRVNKDPTTPWFSEDEIRKFLEPPADTSFRAQRDWLVIATLIGTGLRRREVASLTREQLFQLEEDVVGVSVIVKGNKKGVIRLPKWLSMELQSWCKARNITGPIFPKSQKGPAISRDSIGVIVKRAAKRAGLDPKLATAHGFRRSLVTHARARGVSLEDCQAALLHSSRATTERYDKGVHLMKAAPGDIFEDLMKKGKPWP